jgi:VanZ family protein
LKHARELFWHYWLPVLIMLLLIRLESTDGLSGEHTASHLEHLLRWLGLHPSHRHLELVNLVLRKCGHLLGYGMLGGSWFLLLRGSYWLPHGYKRMLRGSIQLMRIWWRVEWAGLAVLFTFLVASADELHQMEIPSRSGSWTDVAIDTSAAIAAMLLVRARARWHCRYTPQS